MKLFVLRHEERDLTKPFTTTQLTDTGKHRAATSLKRQLEKEDINVIYSSPFLRTLQTVCPYAKSKAIPIRVDHCLHEKIVDDDFKDPECWDFELEYHIKSQFKIDSYYKGHGSAKDVIFPETEAVINRRVMKILGHIEHTHGSTDDRVLICTHMDIVNTIVRHYDHSYGAPFHAMGKLMQVNRNAHMPEYRRVPDLLWRGIEWLQRKN